MNSTLPAFYQKYWNFFLKESPTLATVLGYPGYNHQLPDLSEAHHFGQLATIQSLLKELQSIPTETLEDQVNTQILEILLQERIAYHSLNAYLLPLNPLFGPHLDIPQVLACHPLHTLQDLEDYWSRLRGFQTLIQQCIDLMEKGIEKKVVLPRILTEKCLAQIQAQQVSAVEKSAFYRPFLALQGFSPEEEKEFQEKTRSLIQDYVLPSFSRLYHFLQNTYLPQGKEEVGLWTLPQGEHEYAYWIQHHTTTTLSATEIHEIGWQELETIQEQMKKIQVQVGFSGTLKDFIDHLRSDPQFYYNSETELVEGFRGILQKMDQKLPELFNQLPQAPYELKPVEEYRAESAPEAFYFPSSLDGSRPGYFYINTSNIKSRPKYQMEVLAYHEAVPGHHLQIALAQQMELPEFRRVSAFTGYAEGWALYSEVLPKEIGLYQDPYSEFGRLSFDALRAARLIVDTGIHFFKWTREKAIDFYLKNTCLSERSVVSEIDRYIAYPAQALSYKIGQRKILELRREAEKKLGSRFDIKAFHHKILQHGSLPLTLLEKLFQKWLEPQILE
jgi:uncharacterized protein (DUF885 family)